MSTCCVARHVAGADRFFSWLAGRYARRYLRHGLDRSQRQLLQGLLAAGIQNARVLEIGCGVGYLHQALLRRGAAQATGVDLSAAMLAEAARLGARQGLSARLHYRQGDFVDLAGELPVHDVTLLDKVVCCYPEPIPLLERAAARTGRVMGLVYPRPHLPNRLLAAATTLLALLPRCGFRSYVHDPALVRDTLAAAGLECESRSRTAVWIVEIYRRPPAQAPVRLTPPMA